MIDLEKQYKTFLDYLDVKIGQKDWHGVWDIAVELYTLEKILPSLRDVESN